MRARSEIAAAPSAAVLSDDNRIERCVRRELHAKVTRNHNRADIDELMNELEYHLKQRDRLAAKQ